MPLSGLLCRYGWDNGWPSIYYLLGVVGSLWVVLWFGCVSDSPQKHKRIRDEERNYIVDSLQDTVAKEDKVRFESNPNIKLRCLITIFQRPPVPWRSVLTSKAVLACFIGHFAGDWVCTICGI